MAAATILDNFESPQQLTIYLYSAHRAVIFAIAQLSCCDICPQFSGSAACRSGHLAVYQPLISRLVHCSSYVIRIAVNLMPSIFAVSLYQH